MMRTVGLLLCMLICTFHVAAQQQQAIGLKPRVEGGKWGYTDEAGKFAIQPQFVEARPFSEGLAAVAIGTDPNPTTFVSGTIGEHGFYSGTVERNDLLWGYIDTSGNFVIPPQFKEVGDFSEGFATFSATRFGKWGYINRSGTIVIEPSFLEAEAFKGGRAAVFLGEDCPTEPKTQMLRGGFVGELVILDRSDEETMIRGKRGYIDTRGQFVLTSIKECPPKTR